MMRYRKLIKNNHAGLTSYVMILLGMIVILYLFGFTNMWNGYTGTESGVRIEGGETNPNIEDPSESFEEKTVDFVNPVNMGYGLLNLLINSIYSSLIGVATLGGAIIFLYLFRNNQAVWQFVIPLIILVVLNIFVFPISVLGGDMAVVDAAVGNTVGFSFTLVLIVFFNLFYILAVMDYIKGGTT